jgi:hypothetical protein
MPGICHDGVMAYEFDEQARQEAAERPLSEDQAGRLRDQCVRKAAELGPVGVRGHAVSFSAAAWDDPPGLPASVPRTGRIARGDVLDIGELVRDGKLGTTDLFAASFVWGWGSMGFGPRRYRDIVAAAGGRLELSLQRALAVINKDPGSPDPSQGTRSSTAATTTRPAQRRGRRHGLGCAGSDRPSSRSSCTSPHLPP